MNTHKHMQVTTVKKGAMNLEEIDEGVIRGSEGRKVKKK